MSKITILIPCYNDWSCLNELIPQIDKSLEEIKKDANVIIVNDCSTIKHTLNGINCKNITLKILNLRKNVRAQIAIASGIEYLNKQKIEGNIIVMDAMKSMMKVEGLLIQLKKFYLSNSKQNIEIMPHQAYTLKVLKFNLIGCFLIYKNQLQLDLICKFECLHLI